jgi:hypothetical protein
LAQSLSVRQPMQYPAVVSQYGVEKPHIESLVQGATGAPLPPNGGPRQDGPSPFDESDVPASPPDEDDEVEESPLDATDESEEPPSRAFPAPARPLTPHPNAMAMATLTPAQDLATYMGSFHPFADRVLGGQHDGGGGAAVVEGDGWGEE